MKKATESFGKIIESWPSISPKIGDMVTIKKEWIKQYHKDIKVKDYLSLRGRITRVDKKHPDGIARVRVPWEHCISDVKHYNDMHDSWCCKFLEYDGDYRIDYGIDVFMLV